VRRNKEGVSPVKPLLSEMENAKTLSDLRALQLKYASRSYGVPVSYGFGADEKNAKMNILNIRQSGLTLGQKDYYLDNDKTYQYHGTDGSFVSKDSGGSYTIQLPSDDNVILYANGSYLINNADGSSETGSSKEELNKYLISKNFTVFADLDKKVADIVDYVKKNN